MPVDLTHEIALRWIGPEVSHVPLLKEGGITAVIAPSNESFEKACAAAGIHFIPESGVRLVEVRDAGKAVPGEITLIRSGVWPGVQSPDASVASATRSLWIDQNCHLAGYVRTLYPRLPVLLGYRPDADAGVSAGRVVRRESLELALVEAWVTGGNYIMALDADYRDALLRRADNAMSAWRGLGRTAAWLRAHSFLFGRPALPVVTVLIDHGDMSFEIANLCYRQNLSPALAPAADPPPPDPQRRLVVSAAGIERPDAAIGRRILAHAEAGATVVTDEPGEKAWWRAPGLKPLRSDPDRDVFSLGKGQVVAYREPVSDPGDFALDLIDIVGQKRRATRMWNCMAGLALATEAPRTGPVTGVAAVHIINYGRPIDLPVLVRVQGRFSRGTLLRPEAAPVELKTAPRGTASEVALPQLACVATVVFR